MRRLFLSWAVLSCAFAGAAVPAMAANCSVTPFNAMPGADTSAHMVVRSGLPCSVQMNVRGGGMQMSVGQAAVNGRVTVPGPTSFAYVSRPGFVGKDRFEADFTGELMNSGRGQIMRGTSHIAVDVDVVR